MPAFAILHLSMLFPFRLGTTSYIYEDDLIGNVRRLGPLVDDIELVLFDTMDYGTNIPDAATVAELNRLAAAHHLTFTVHLPEDIWPGNGSLEKAARAIDATRALHPHAYIVHFDGRTLGDDITPWQHHTAAALDAVIAMVGDPALVCAENLERWNPELFDDLVAAAGVARCVDIGHLWLEHRDPLPYLTRHLPSSRVVHLHGIAERDHASLEHVPFDDVFDIIYLLLDNRFAGVVTLEVFSEADFFGSLQVLERCRKAIKP
jgi:sugar phosphate isomerase/epimerase